MIGGTRQFTTKLKGGSRCTLGAQCRASNLPSPLVLLRGPVAKNHIHLSQLQGWWLLRAAASLCSCLLLPCRLRFSTFWLLAVAASDALGCI